MFIDKPSLWLIPAILTSVGTANASQYLIVTHGTGGSWSLQGAETVLVNGKEKIRQAPFIPAGAATPWDSKSIGRQAEARFPEFNVVRRLADGSLVGRSGTEWKLLLPEGVKSKDAAPAAKLWQDSSLGYRQDRKDKTEAAIRWQDFYAIVPGADPAAAAAALATDLSWHMLPGISSDEAFRQMILFLPQAAKNSPTGASADTIRTFLSAGIAARLRTWREGDAEVAVLDQADALAGAAQSAFPSDAGLNALRAEFQERRKWLDRRVAILRALDAGKQADPFLIAYREFEPFDRSFPQLSQARTAHLNASAGAHFDTGRELQKSGDYAGAIRHLLIAKWRNPKLAGVDDLLEQVRLEAARMSSQRLAAARGTIDPRSPARVQMQRKLLMVEQFINDHKQEDAERALSEAEAMDSGEPRLALLYAQLAVSRGELGRALALLDNYAGNALTPEDLAEGEKLRASVLYGISKERTKTAADTISAFEQQKFSSALNAAADGLKIDNESPQFLYQASVNTCVLRNCDRAVPLLQRYLEVTDSTQADRRQRIMAIRLLSEADAAGKTSAALPTPKVEATDKSWFSGTPLGSGTWYDPVSLAFQPKVAHIEASEHVTVAYEWKGNQLDSVHTRYEAKKTAGNIARLAIAGAAASQGIGSTVGWRTPDRETNDFYFNYYDDVSQVLKVSRDKMLVKSRTIPISIPGIGGFGGLGMMGGLTGGMSMLGGLKGLGGMRGMPAGMPGLAGAIPGAPSGGSGILGRLGLLGGGAGGFNSFGAARQFIPSQHYSIRSDPDGNSSSGYLTLWNNPRLDTRLAWKITGKRAAVGFSGNRFFHPFVWDAIHLFELDYDEQGRVLHAWEIGDANAPRLDFAWDGQRLMNISAHDSSGRAIYSRTLNYSGDRLTGESISQAGGKNARIEYKYDKQGRLIEADCDSDQTLDGRSRKVHFLAEAKN